jgi:2-dehydropantoate 2-reductase
MAYKNILVVGGGAIGGITAAFLTQKSENVVVLDVDKEHVQMMRKGLEITGFRELTVPVKAMLPTEFIVKDFAGWADIVLFAVKGLHTEKALISILPSVAKAAPVVSMQNGINEETIARIVGIDRTIGCSITWGGTNKGPGQLLQTAEGGFIIGQWSTGRSQRADDAANLLSQAFPAEVSDNIIGDRWTKLLITVSMTGVGTIAGLTYGGIVDNEVARKVALAVITETYEIGKATGVNFVPLQGISPAIFLVHNKIEFENASRIMEIGFSKHREIKPSMWQDIEKGRKTEVDLVNGHVVRKGKEIGRPTPANELVTRIIKQIEEGEKQPGLDNLKAFNELIAHLN